MRNHFTICLEPETTMRVRMLTKSFGGSIGGFAADWASEVSKLEPNDIVKVREFITALQAAKKTTE